MGFFERKTVTPRRLEWVAVEESKFKDLVERLVSHSNSLEGLLESTLVKKTYDTYFLTAESLCGNAATEATLWN